MTKDIDLKDFNKRLHANMKKKAQEKKRAQEHRQLARYYNMNSILGNHWAMFYAIIGSRKTGKSYSLTDFLLRQHLRYGDGCKNYWMRISESSTKALLLNRADKLVDPDLKRKYDLDLTTKGPEVFNRGKVFCTVLPLSQFGKQKGIAYYDKDFRGKYNIVLDEFQLEEGEKRTSFDILYSFIQMLENLVRTEKQNVRVFLLGNTLEEACSILKAFNFLPEKFGRFYLRSKRCVIDNLEPTEEYLKDRKGSAADLLGGDNMSNYTNMLKKDTKLISKQRLISPQARIVFSKDRAYTLWNNNIIRLSKGEFAPYDIAMRPYLGIAYNREKAQTVFERYDAEAFKFKSLIDQAYFSDDLKLLKKGR